MRKQVWLVKRIVVAVLAAVVLLTGALNVRTVIGGLGAADDHEWAVDPTSLSATDQLAGVTSRVPTELDDQIVALQDQLRAAPDRSEAASLLGLAYLQKVRETGDPSYYPKAETLFNQALDHNEDDLEALIGLGTLALARHDFAGALEWGQKAVKLNPYHAAAYGVIGDAQIELGRYDEAVATFQQMVNLRPDLTSFTRVSYARELYGDVHGAINAMERAAQAGAGRAEHVAWTHVQLGNLLFNSGDFDGAEARYDASLQTLDGYVYGLAGLAKVNAARGDFPTAITLYQHVIQTMPLAEFVIALGDVYTAAGQPDEAASQYALVDAMQALYRENGVDTDVEMALFEVDHNRNLDEAVKQAQAGYKRHPSIRAADVLAWTLFKTGNLTDAQKYSNEALRLGTKDALLLFHAGTIQSALGNRDAAIGYLQQALAINPHFSLIYADQAQTELTRLQATQ
jgi:tetratricopeptide (TPR) repeat protein